MSDDQHLWPLDASDDAPSLNDGTTPRIRTAKPGPTGAAKSTKPGGTKQSVQSLGEKVLRYARTHRGEQVGTGECFDLADLALRSAGARSAASYGAVTDDGDYVWGQSVPLAQVQPGDIVQFRDYRFRRTVNRPDGAWTETSEDRPHHTAVVESVATDGVITVLEQNVPVGGAVQRTVLYFSSVRQSVGGDQIVIVVSGDFWFYRPEARSP